MREPTRTCKKCKIEKPIDCFYRFDSNRARRRFECIDCIKIRTKERRETETYRRFKKDKCDNCGFVAIHKCQLDVDHIDGNHFNDDPSNLQTLCANCHRLKTYVNKEFRLRIR